MCYSAQIKADYARFVSEYGAHLSIKDYFDLFWRRLSDPSIQVPRAVESAFASPQSEETREIQSLIARHAAQHIEDLRSKQASQLERLAKAEAKLAVKATKTAVEEKRIAGNKIAAFQERIDQLEQARLETLDYRIFPGSYVPVMVWEGGQRVFKPMRYRCRPWNKPESFDTEYPGCYNARRDSLKGFWRDLYGSHHGVVILSAFYEHVPRHLAEGRPPDEAPGTTQVEFRPDQPQDLLAACIWSRWSRPGQPDLVSFALITEDPPPEIAAVGHDRCICTIRPEDLDAWLQPSRANMAAQDAILDRRLRPHYAHSVVPGAGAR
jgi:putative SOS response-associated peptidase YedK